MANAPQPAQSSFFQDLINRVGLGGALQLLSLLDPNGNAASKGLAGGKLATSGLAALGFNPKFGDIGMNLGIGKVPILPAAISGAGIGYNLSQIANNPNFSTGQKIGHGVGDTTNAVLGAIYPYYGLGVLAKSVVGQLEKSGSPQVAAMGRALSGPALPVEGLLSVLQGDQTPREAFNTMIARTGNIPVVGHGMKQVLQAFGLGTPPTTGTVVRDQIGQVANQIPALKGFKMGQDVLTADQYNAFKPETQKNAYALADLLGSYAPAYKKDQQAYQIQLGNSLLKQYGDSIPDVIRQVLSPAKQTAAPAPIAPGVGMTAQETSDWASKNPAAYQEWLANYAKVYPTGAATMSRFQPGLSNKGVSSNKLAGIMDLTR